MHIVSRQGPRSRPRRSYGHAAASSGGVVSSGLIADYRMPGQSGTTVVDSLGSFNGTFGGLPAHGSIVPAWTPSGLFFGANNWMGATLPVPIASVKTVQAVFTVSSAGVVAEAGTMGIIGSDNTTGLIWNLSGRGYPVGAGFPFPDFYHSGPTENSFGWGMADVPECFTWTNPGAGGDRCYVDDHPYATMNYGTNPDLSATGRVGNLFFGCNGIGFGFLGTIHRLLVYSRAITEAESVANYAALVTWAATVGLTLGNPNPLTGKNNLVCIGDSITFNGAVTSTSWEGVYAAHAAHATVAYNAAQSGLTAAIYDGYDPWLWRKLYAPAAKSNIAGLLLGTNDFIGGASVATAIGHISSIVGKLLAIGYKVALLPMLCRAAGSSAVSDATKNAYNAAVASTFGSTPGVTVIPASAYATLTGDGTDTNLTYFQADGTHPTAAGSSDMAIGGVGSDTGVKPYLDALLVA